MTVQQKKILLIDGANMFFRAFTANPALNIDGEHIGAITGFLYSLQKCIKDVRPHEIFVIWDGAGGSKKRREIRSDYKEGRKMPRRPINLNRALDLVWTDEEETARCWYQQQRLVSILNCLPICQLCEAGVEADDFISHLIRLYDCADNYLKVIVSNDKDFVQLLDSCTLIYRPITKKYVSCKDAIEEDGVHPVNMALARSIDGDKSDNLSGIKGVGLKSVVSIFPEFGNPKEIGIDDLEKLCQQRLIKDEKKQTKNAKVQAILDGMKVIKENYQIMQLYTPMISATAKFAIEEQMANYKPTISVDKFYDELKSDGLIGGNFNALISHGTKMILGAN